jgi:hypothetical protein
VIVTNLDFKCLKETGIFRDVSIKLFFSPTLSSTLALKYVVCVSVHFLAPPHVVYHMSLLSFDIVHTVAFQHADLSLSKNAVPKLYTTQFQSTFAAEAWRHASLATVTYCHRVQFVGVTVCISWTLQFKHSHSWSYWTMPISREISRVKLCSILIQLKQ